MNLVSKLTILSTFSLVVSVVCRGYMNSWLSNGWVEMDPSRNSGQLEQPIMVGFLSNCSPGGVLGDFVVLLVALEQAFLIALLVEVEALVVWLEVGGLQLVQRLGSLRLELLLQVLLLQLLQLLLLELLLL